MSESRGWRSNRSNYKWLAAALVTITLLWPLVAQAEVYSPAAPPTTASSESVSATPLSNFNGGEVPVGATIGVTVLVLMLLILRLLLGSAQGKARLGFADKVAVDRIIRRFLDGSQREPSDSPATPKPLETIDVVVNAPETGASSSVD